MKKQNTLIGLFAFIAALLILSNARSFQVGSGHRVSCENGAPIGVTPDGGDAILVCGSAPTSTATATPTPTATVTPEDMFMPLVIGANGVLQYASGQPFYLSGPGDPEGFLYRGTRNADGTRSGDQMTLINKLAPTGANSIYMQIVRSHGGDGDSTHNPFVGSDPDNGIDTDIISQWHTWFAAMDDAGIVIYLFIYDDSACIWDCTGQSAVPAAEQSFIAAIVAEFAGYDHLIWCIAEEYSESFSAARVSNMAAIIRANDASHPIAVHQLHGTSFDFSNDNNINQFAMQYNNAGLHDAVETAVTAANGQYSVVMSEAALHGSTDAEIRRNSWRVAMTGGHVMVLGMDIANTSVASLEQHGYMTGYLPDTNWHEMAPADNVASGSTLHAMINGDDYLAYSESSGDVGLSDLASGDYDLLWIDTVTGDRVTETAVSVAGGDTLFSRPVGIGTEAAVWIYNFTPASGGTTMSVLDHVETGTVTLSGGSSSVTDTLVTTLSDKNKSFLVFGIEPSDDSPQFGSVSGELTNTTTLTFRRSASTHDIVIRWFVAEFASGVAVQHGHLSVSLGVPNYRDVTISAVDTSKAFVIHSRHSAGTSWSADDFETTEFTSTTNLRFECNDADYGGNIDLYYQVIEIDDASVQYGTIALGTGDTSGTDTISSVNTGRTMLVTSMRSDNGTRADIGQKLYTAELSDSTTVTVTRENSGQAMTVAYFAVELAAGNTVQSGTASFGTSDTQVDTTISAVDTDNTIAILGGFMHRSGRASYASDDEPSVASFTAEFTATTNLRLARDTHFSTAAVAAYYVIEFATSSIERRIFVVN